MATYLVSEATGKKYLVVGANKETKEITIENTETGSRFVETFTKERMEKLGYKMVRVDEPATA